MAMETLKEIAVKNSKKQPEMVNSLTEEAPILETCKWKAATHQMWNVAEVMKDVTGPGYVNMNAPLPAVGVSSGTEKVDLSILGGEMEVPQDTADQFGGPAKYFADKQPHVLKKAGNDTEATLFYKNWLQFAIDNKNIIKAGTGAGNGVNSIVICRFDEAGNTGLYDPTQFDQGALLKVTAINGGNLMPLRNAPYTGVNGYAVQLKGRFGWQLLNPKTVSAIVNLKDDTGKLTETMLDDAIAMARGKSGTTFVFCHPLAASHFINPLKIGRTQVTVKDHAMDTMIDTWNGITVVTSYNLLWGAEQAVV